MVIKLFPKDLKAKLYNDDALRGEFDLSKTSQNDFVDEYVFSEFKKISFEDYIKSKNFRYIKSKEISNKYMQ
ncbi:MAG: hypothetical protein ACTHL3_08740 [Candidatus Nitrosocosmicus sp.]